jgi:pimeloyl-ACP methyl ester carboxylesterase
VFEAMAAFREARAATPVDPNRVVLRGFSMGGAGAWHIGLRHPSQFCVIGPGAGFTTHGYIANLRRNCPTTRRSACASTTPSATRRTRSTCRWWRTAARKDAQKKAADNIENALKGFKEPLKFTHLVAPNLGTPDANEWQEKAEARVPQSRDKGTESESPRQSDCDVHPDCAAGDDGPVIDALVATYTNVRSMPLGRGKARRHDNETSSHFASTTGAMDAPEVTLSDRR